MQKTKHTRGTFQTTRQSNLLAASFPAKAKWQPPKPSFDIFCKGACCKICCLLLKERTQNGNLWEASWFLLFGLHWFLNNRDDWLATLISFVKTPQPWTRWPFLCCFYFLVLLLKAWFAVQRHACCQWLKVVLTWFKITHCWTLWNG